MWYAFDPPEGDFGKVSRSLPPLRAAGRCSAYLRGALKEDNPCTMPHS